VGGSGSVGDFLGVRRAAWLATALAVVISIFVSFKLPWYFDLHGWLMPGDISWMTRSAQWVDSGAMGSVYAANHWYLTLPGYLFLLAPVVQVGDMLHLANNYPFPIPHPTMWLLTGPFTALCCAAVIPATDRLAAALSVPKLRRDILAVAVAVLVAVPTTIFSGHGEDMLALAGVELATVAAVGGHWSRVGWILALAVLFQEWALLAVPVLVAASPQGQKIKTAWHALLPGASLGMLLLALDWKNAYFDLIVQPAVFKGQKLVWWQWAKVVAIPGTSVFGVTGSTFRTCAVAVAVVAGIVVWKNPTPTRIAAAVAVALFARGFFEVELWPYYLAPAAVMIVLLAGRAPAKRAAVAAAAAFGAYAVSNSAYVGVSTNPWLATAVLAACAAMAYGALAAPGALRPEALRAAVLRLGALLLAALRLSDRPSLNFVESFKHLKSRYSAHDFESDRPVEDEGQVAFD
jgi:hypothetical protein